MGTSALFAAWIGWHLGGKVATRTFDDTVTALVALAATLACWQAGRAHSGRLRQFWQLLAVALAAWTFAETVWAIYDLVLKVPVPVPSWADLGYLGAIPFAAAALLSHPAMHQRRPRKARAALDGVVTAMALLFVSWTLVLGPLWRQTDLSTLGGVVAVAYPFGDIVMLFLVVLVLRSMRNGDRFGLWCVLGGIVAMAVADSTYTYLSEVGSYSTGNMVDVGWVVGYLFLGLGAFGASPQPVEEVAPERAPSLVSVIVPFVPVLVALVTLAVEIRLGHKLLFTDWVMALALTLFAIGRQALAVFDGFVPAGADGPLPPGAAQDLAGEPVVP
ncbi:MAG TPA: hypothetical protein VL984_15090 [Acidimicrobiales bacterium]|nr:hypothetical protein [Acidimicrobiales bacterium]